MDRSKALRIIMITSVILSLFTKIFLIFKYENLLTLSSDDLNYVKSAVVLSQKGLLTYYNLNEPSVFVMPAYPLLMAGFFKLLGYGMAGLQGIRIAQAFMSCVIVIMIYLISRKLFSNRVAVITAVLVSFYPPNIITPGLLLTETLFMMLLYILIYLSITFSENPSNLKFVILGLLWALTVLCRPTIALYPLFLFLYLLIYRRFKIKQVIRLGALMGLTFAVVLAPWWVRNYIELGEFIPLTASSGNPMLQGTYVDYEQTPGNTVYYKLGETAYETDKIEVEVAKERIKNEFSKDFWSYLKWYTSGKTYYFWNGAFYWKDFLNIGLIYVLTFHRLLLLGFAGIIILVFRNFSKYLLPVSIIIYFNLVHCIYMAFDRYAYPLMPLLSMFFAFFVVQAVLYAKSTLFKLSNA